MPTAAAIRCVMVCSRPVRITSAIRRQQAAVWFRNDKRIHCHAVARKW
ncbi:hypothetical protein KCP71_00520 [Salmonella enterica subsp. enterica]|nr:hypothetical protein KCP71_00520 [Salmonella enterica subsp. enterica]